MIQVTIGHYWQLVSRGRPWVYIKTDSTEYKNLSSEKCELFVIENDAATLGMDGKPLGDCRANEVRVWNKADWLLCDNKRWAAARRLEAIAQAARDKREKQITWIKAQWSTMGMLESIANMMMATLDNDKLAETYKQMGGPAIE